MKDFYLTRSRRLVYIFSTSIEVMYGRFVNSKTTIRWNLDGTVYKIHSPQFALIFKFQSKKW